MNAEQRTSIPNRMAELRDRISDCFSPDDLHGLAFDFGLDLDKFEGSSFDRRVVELIEIILRRQQIIEFVQRCHEKKPRGNFQPLLDAANNEPHSFQLQTMYSTPSPSSEDVDLLSKSIAMFTMLREQANREAAQIQSQKPISQADFTKPPSLRKSDLGIHSVSRASWDPRSNSRENLASVTTQAQTFKSNLSNDEAPLSLDRLQQDIVQLRKNLDALGELDGLLENIDDLLSSMRRKIKELLDDINEKHQRMQDERIRVVEKSDAYAQSQRFAPPPGKKNDWGDHNFTKPN
ncbi:MAG: hypothetical protein H6657_16015 [Ardenticatenaceae bacterium]|nr:hypothetical protein [Ardenticatenaceae bacterium]